MTDTPDIAARIRAVREQIEQATVRSGRAPGSVQLLLATKTVPAERIREAITAGASLIGENRVQELTEKAADLADLAHTAHFIGHLQTNKINQVLRHVSAVQSIDSAALADKVSARWTGEQPLEVFIQVNCSGEVSKFGCAPEQAADIAGQVGSDENLQLRGFMTIGLFSPDLPAVRASYARLREVRDTITALHLPGTHAATELSMGMSGDFREAILEGATMVRIGTTVFGQRPTSDSYYWPE